MSKFQKYNGRNVFGETCIAKSVDLKKETAVEQYLAALEDVEAHHGQRIEYTLTSKSMTPEELQETMEEVGKIMRLRSMLRSGPHFPTAA